MTVLYGTNIRKERSNNYNPKTDRNVRTAQDRKLNEHTIVFSRIHRSTTDSY